MAAEGGPCSDRRSATVRASRSCRHLRLIFDAVPGALDRIGHREAQRALIERAHAVPHGAIAVGAHLADAGRLLVTPRAATVATDIEHDMRVVALPADDPGAGLELQ